MATPINNENQDESDVHRKMIETAARNTAIQMGCWTAADDYLLVTSVLHLCDLERIHKQVKFTMPFSLQNIEDRWHCLLYDVPISKLIVTKIQQLSMLQIETLRIPFNDEEERLLASIPSYTLPNLLEDELDALLSKNTLKFWANRTINELRDYWLKMRQQGRLNDQQGTLELIRAKSYMEVFHRVSKYLENNQKAQTIQDHAISRKLSQLLAPFEFEILTRNSEQFSGKTAPPFAVLHANNRLFCMYSDQLSFGTCYPDRQFDVSFDNSTKIHIQGFITRQLGSFYIINNGENAFRVNHALLNPNEASPLGNRAIVNILDHLMIFQAIELP